MPRLRKRVLILALAVVATMLLWCVGVMTAIGTAAAPNPNARGDVAIVLGAAVWGDEPSPVFQARIDHAVALYERGQVERVVFTGGTGSGDALSEAEAAKQSAIMQGVPGDAILVETRSKTTGENLANAQRIMQANGLRTAVIVSDPYHMLRAGMHARRLGIRHILSPTETTRYVGFSAKAGQLTRETYYVTRLLLTGR